MGLQPSESTLYLPPPTIKCIARQESPLPVRDAVQTVTVVRFRRFLLCFISNATIVLLPLTVHSECTTFELT
jgi:hypothetical protein